MRINPVMLAAAIAVMLAGCASAGSGHAAAVSTAPQAPAASAPATTPPAAPPAPNAKGNYSGSCDYTLANDPSGNDYLVGEVDVHNTGNIGTVNRVRITWPQEGLPPVTARKTVRLAAGASKPVRFHVSAGSIAGGSNVIDLLQSWQTSHEMRDGCTYHVSITGTYGSPQ